MQPAVEHSVASFGFVRMEATTLLRIGNVVEVSHINGVGWASPIGKGVDLSLPSVLIACVKVDVEDIVRGFVIFVRELQAVSSSWEDSSVINFEFFFNLVVN